MTPALYPALKSNLWVALRPGHFAERKRFRKSAGWWSNALRGGWCSAGLPASSSALLLRNFRGRIALRHNRAQKPQHRVSLPRRCTDATWPGGWAHKSSQPPTRGFVALVCGVRCRWVVFGRESPGKNLPPVLNFLNFLRALGLPTEDDL